MPIYGYTCGSCGYEFDRLQKLSEADPTDCPHCGKAKLHRQLTAPAFRLAGSGWYETDFKGAGDKKHNLAGDGDLPQSPAPAKAEPKPESATPAAASKPAATKAAASAG